MKDTNKLMNISLHKNIVSKVKTIVTESDGLFENEDDYINHCITYYNRRNPTTLDNLSRV